MDLGHKIESIIAAPLQAEGYEIVRVVFTGNKHKVLQIMIEREDGEIPTVADCSKASHIVSVYLDVENPIKSHYNLEISSPGLNRPLVKFKDFERFCGENIVVKTFIALEGKKRFAGKLIKAQDDEITMSITQSKDDSAEITLAFNDIQSAKLDVDFEALFKEKKL